MTNSNMDYMTIFHHGKILLFIFFSGVLFSCHAEQRICIVLSEQNKIYDQIEEGFEIQILKQFPELEIKKVILDEKSDCQKEILDFYPDVNFAIGTSAVKICDALTVFPFVYTMVLNPVNCGLRDHSGKSLSYCSGISVIMDPGSQFIRLKEIMPEIKKIGTLYSEKSAILVEKARKAALSLKLTFYAEKVDYIDQVPKAFRKLMKNSPEVFWLILDTEVLSADTLSYFSEACKAAGMNFLTFNPNHLKQGASMAVYLDYFGLGKQAAEMISRVLKGDSVNKIPEEEAKYNLCKVEESNFYLSHS